MIKRIVLTGGPGSGKTTVLDTINKVYTSLNYKVIIVEETATYLIEKGIRPFGDGAINLIDFQELVLGMQLAKERIIDRATEMMNEENIIIVYDRGAIDNCAYVSEEEFRGVLKRLNNVKTFAELMNKYDLVINLVGRKDFYTKENNQARSEEVDEALKLGEKSLKSWLGHKKIKIVLPKDKFEDKIKEVLNIINAELKEKQIKRQEKYLVDLTKTDINLIKQNGRIVHITQDYLMSTEDVEKRIRKVIINGCCTYQLSVYKILEDKTRIIVSEKEIDKKIYESLLEFKDQNTKTIEKTRIYFNYKGKYFYLDIFDNNNHLGIIEVNVLTDDNIEIPDFIHIIENVTNDISHYNKTIATNNYSRNLSKLIM